ncbi:MAG: PEP-CTERM sorting domain-containing protein [Planctomycetia bacterium]|nr:PEP-CTERM sorting domain-containing protein [Planctomycetia bacterium]
MEYKNLSFCLLISLFVFVSQASGDGTYTDLDDSTHTVVTEGGTITLNNTQNANFTGSFTGSPTKIIVNAAGYTQGLYSCGMNSTGTPQTGILTGFFSTIPASLTTSVTIESGTLDFTSEHRASGGTNLYYGLAFTVADGATLQYNTKSNGQEISTVEIQKGGTLKFNTNTQIGKIFSGVISGAGDVYFNGTSPLDSNNSYPIDLYPNNTYTGDTYIWGGNKDATGNTLIAFARARGNVEGNYFGTTGTIILDYGAISNTSAGSPTISNNIEVRDYGILRAGNGNSLTFKGNISGTGKLYIARDNGTVYLGGNNVDHTGGVEIGTSPLNFSSKYGSTVKITHANALGSGPVNFNYSPGDDTSLSPTTLDLEGYDVTIGGLSSLKYGTTDEYVTKVYFYDSVGGGNVTIKSSVAAGQEAIYAGYFTDPNGNHPVASITITGEGTQTFANTIPENTKLIVDGGTVKLSSEIATETVVGNMHSKITVKSGGVLTTDYDLTYPLIEGGSATDYIDIAGGDFSDNGTLRIDIYNLDEFSRFDLTAPIADTDYNSDLGFVSTNLLTEGGFTPTAGDFFNLSYNVSQFNSFTTDVNLEMWLSVKDRALWDLNWYATNVGYGTNTLVLEYVGILTPEPSTWGMLLLGILGMMYFRKKRVQK